MMNETPVGVLEDPKDGVERHTIEGWNESEFFNFEVWDPDGFNRRDPQLMKRLFTREEFESGAGESTCRFWRVPIEAHAGETAAGG